MNWSQDRGALNFILRLNLSSLPGLPKQENGYIQSDKTLLKRVKNSFGKGYGWLDQKGALWVPSGKNTYEKLNWKVYSPSGHYELVFPSLDDEAIVQKERAISFDQQAEEGWPDESGAIWFPAGDNAYIRTHWNVCYPDGFHKNVFPKGDEKREDHLIDQGIVLVCEDVIFCSPYDESAFFEWVARIDCIEGLSALTNSMFLHIVSSDLHDQDVNDLMSLFHRYKIDMKQLQQFVTPGDPRDGLLSRYISSCE